jgi:hypothetical protein
MGEVVAAMVLIDTDDAELQPENLSVATPAATAALRRAVIRNLPQREASAVRSDGNHVVRALHAGRDELTAKPPCQAGRDVVQIG